jgi:hypothetical protein
MVPSPLRLCDSRSSYGNSATATVSSRRWFPLGLAACPDSSCTLFSVPGKTLWGRERRPRSSLAAASFGRRLDRDNQKRADHRRAVVLSDNDDSTSSESNAVWTGHGQGVPICQPDLKRPKRLSVPRVANVGDVHARLPLPRLFPSGRGRPKTGANLPSFQRIVLQSSCLPRSTLQTPRHRVS